MTLSAATRRHLATAGAIIALGAVAACVVLIVAIVRAGGSDAFSAGTIGGLNLIVSYVIVGWLVASRRSDNPIGWVFLAIGLSLAVEVFASLGTIYGLVAAPGSLPLADVLSWVAVWAWVPGFTLLVTFSLLLFPDGRLPSPRWRPVAWLSIVMMVLLGIPVAIVAWPLRGITLATGSLDELGGAAGVIRQIQFIGFLLIPVVAPASIAALVTRFRRSTGQERQQLKWFTYAAIPEIGFLVSSQFLTVPPAVQLPAAFLIAPLLPLAAGVAILRYRLYDIDRIISRTVSYGAVTGILAVVYVGTILVSQTVLASFFSGNSVAVAASTLVVAALFQPLRRWVQRVVDRRFNRSRYDAERTVEAFGARLRDEVDLANLKAEVRLVVAATVTPTAVGLWIRQPDPGS